MTSWDGSPVPAGKQNSTRLKFRSDFVHNRPETVTCELTKGAIAYPQVAIKTREIGVVSGVLSARSVIWQDASIRA